MAGKHGEKKNSNLHLKRRREVETEEAPVPCLMACLSPALLSAFWLRQQGRAGLVGTCGDDSEILE